MPLDSDSVILSKLAAPGGPLQNFYDQVDVRAKARAQQIGVQKGLRSRGKRGIDQDSPSYFASFNLVRLPNGDAIWTNTAEHAKYIEFGNEPNRGGFIYSTKKKVLRFQTSGGAWVFAAKVRPMQDAPYGILEQSVTEVIREISQGRAF